MEYLSTLLKVYIILCSYFITSSICRHVSPESSSNYNHQNVRSIGYRNGGFPKFPESKSSYQLSSEESSEIRGSSATCGLRNIFHDMIRNEMTPTGRVIGGSQVPYGAYPWTANIALKNSRGSDHHCGGAIISRKFILTAAHCIDGFEVDEFVVKVGDDSRIHKDQNEQILDIESWKLHPKFRVGGVYMNDLAILKLPGSGMVLSAAVSPACLPTKRTSHQHGTWCYVSGWGLTQSDEEYKTDFLRAASVPILSADVCTSDTVHGAVKVGPGMVCAGYLEGGVDACRGDSGGPLVCEDNGSFNVLGIVSWGSGCAMPNKPGVYTKVQYYLDWIHQSMEQM